MHYQSQPLAQSNAPSHNGRVYHHHPSHHQSYPTSVSGSVDVYTSPYRRIEKGLNSQLYGLSTPITNHSSTHHNQENAGSSSKSIYQQLEKEKENSTVMQNKTKELENKLSQYEGQQQYYVQLEAKIKMLIKENDRLVGLVEHEKSQKAGRFQDIETKLRMLVSENEKLNKIILDMEKKCKSLIVENQKLQEKQEPKNDESKYTSLNDENKLLQNQVQEKEKQRIALVSEKEQNMNELQDLEEKIALIISENQRLQNITTCQNSENNEKDGSFQYEQKYNELQEIVETKDQEICKQNMKIIEIDEELKQKEIQIFSMKQQMDGQQNNENTENIKNTTEISSLQDKLVSLTIQNEELQRDNEILNVKLQNLQNQQSDSEISSINNLQSQIEEIQNQESFMEKKYCQEIIDLQTKIKNQEQLYETVKLQVNKLHSLLNQHELLPLNQGIDIEKKN